MKPDVDQTLRTLAEAIFLDVGPHVHVDYPRRIAEGIAALLLAAGEEWDRAAAWRVEENRTLRRLFREAALAVADPALRDRLERTGRGRPRSLRIHDLDRENDRLRQLLIELHAYVEGRDDPRVRAIDEAIWRELRTSTQRRALSFWPL